MELIQIASFDANPKGKPFKALEIGSLPSYAGALTTLLTYVRRVVQEDRFAAFPRPTPAVIEALAQFAQHRNIASVTRLVLAIFQPWGTQPGTYNRST